MIRLLFTAANTPSSEIIQKLDVSGVSHVGIQFGEDKILSAEARGVVEHSLISFMSQGARLVAAYEATPEGEKHLLLWRARAHVKARYGWKSIPGLAVTTFFKRWLGKDKKNPIKDKKGIFCSELVLLLDDETGFVTEFIGLDAESTTPGDILLKLRLGGPTFRCVFDNGAN